MWAVLHLLFALVFDRLKSRRRLEMEHLYLRHQLNVVMRRAPLSLPKIPSARAWQHERESAHPTSRCGPCFTCSLLLSSTVSSRGAGLRSRTYICAISSMSRCGSSSVCDCAALIEHSWS